MDNIHVPVLQKEVLKYLDLKAGDSYIDCTFGAGGHAQMVYEVVGNTGRILGLDRDDSILKKVRTDWETRKNVIIVNERFSRLSDVAKANNFKQVDGILMDLGVSSWQLDDAKRGFSFQAGQKLDMQMGKNQMTAADFLNSAEVDQLKEVLKNYGDVKNGSLIAKRIVAERKKRKIEKTDDLLNILADLHIVKGARRNLLARIWQAIRMYVNDEETELENGLRQAVDLLKKGGRLVVISFHSGESRIVKDFFQKNSRSCVCPKDFPKCVCQNKPLLRLVTRKSIKPTKEEIFKNSRASSAVLRVVEKI